MSPEINRKARESKNSYSKVLKDLGPYLTLGLQLAISVGVFVLLGWWLDAKFETAPRWIIICSIAGSVVGLYNFFKTIAVQEKKRKKEESGNKK